MEKILGPRPYTRIGRARGPGLGTFQRDTLAILASYNKEDREMSHYPLRAKIAILAFIAFLGLSCAAQGRLLYPIAVSQSKTAYIDSKGEVLIPAGNLPWVYPGEMYGFKPEAPPEEGDWAFQADGKKKMKLRGFYQDRQVYGDFMIGLRNEDEGTYVDLVDLRSGEAKLSFGVASIHDFRFPQYGSTHWVQYDTVANKLVVVDLTEGRKAFETSEYTIRDFSEGMLRFDGFHGGGFLDLSGKLVWESSDFLPYPYSGGLCAIKSYDNGLWGFADLQGKVTIPMVYKRVSSFAGSLALAVLDDAKTRVLIDRKGSLVATLPRGYDTAALVCGRYLLLVGSNLDGSFSALYNQDGTLALELPPDIAVRPVYGRGMELARIGSLVTLLNRDQPQKFPEMYIDANLKIVAPPALRGFALELERYLKSGAGR